MSPRPTRKAPRSRRRRIIGALAGLFLLIVVLGVLALPFLGVPGEAEAAKEDLDTAVSALQSGDLRASRDAVADAREHVDAAQGDIQGLGGDVWSVIPFLGTPVADARHLVQALDDATAVAEIGVDLSPKVSGKQATLFRDDQVDEATLDEVLEGTRRIADHLRSAEAELDDVRGTSPVVGTTIAARRDEAAAQVTPMLDTYEGLEPTLDQLPAFLGFEGERSYLVAMLNPAELRYSGGAALAFSPLFFDEGSLELGESRTVANDPGLQTEASWRKVSRNNFHLGKTRVANSTFAPGWSVSGEELLRAWRETHDKRHDGVIALDVVALSKLLGVVGGIEVPGYGEVTQSNLVETLIGSYDQYYPDPNAQDSLNDPLIPAFKDAMFSGGDYLTKARALGAAADGRHFAMYFRDEAVQEGITTLGLDGDLADVEGDYVGVFTQNINGSKVDYFQRRRLSLDVTLGKEGAATNQLDVVVDNATPPYALPVPDPRFGYFTRYAVINVAAFLPAGISMDQATLRGESWEPRVRSHYQHSYAVARMELDPATYGEASMDYTVPDAATVDEAGNLVYRLAIDPQGTVDPQTVEVRVHIPRGYRATTLPEGWSARGRTLSFTTGALEATQTWEIPIAATESTR
ncbi:DUF4012 domain-containing protein [Nocardioides euryhalodurans]|uniref:DUF4012 domain-containing protein n=1 Tax=Nocardioides euryhalodurans TaxID=2518370 RepID=A0A4P7GMN6_9ACTN|nr:DUF4012 domain-containing protein [Nocardioides euryhalodurans]QBR93406.1 DUF4012 domain-containing protein [Nocardioides euryhalodurans]